MRLNQVTLAVDDMAAACSFYRRLGLTLIVDSAPRYVRFELPGGETLSLHHEPGWAGADWPPIYFEYDDLDGECARLESEGLTLLNGPEDKRYGWREADIMDPSGNRIRLFSAGNNRRFPPWRVASSNPPLEETPQ